MLEEQFSQLKREYQETKTPDFLIYNGWTNVRSQLTDRKFGVFWFVVRRISLAVLFLALIFGGVVTTSRAVAPGDFLYPVKVAGENLYAKISGNYQRPIENRIQDVVKTSSQGDGNLDEAIKQYENTLDQSRNQSQDQQSRDQFKATLQDQADELRQAQEKSTNQKDREKLQQVIERTNEVRGEIKGAKDNLEGSHGRQENGRGD